MNRTSFLMHLVAFLKDIGIRIVLATFLTPLFLLVCIILYIVRITQHRMCDILYPKLLELERLERLFCLMRKIGFFFLFSFSKLRH